MHRMRGERPQGGYGNGAFPDMSRRRGRGQLLLQCNLNCARRAQDIMFQSLVERRIGLAAVTEPYCSMRHGALGT